MKKIKVMYSGLRDDGQHWKLLSKWRTVGEICVLVNAEAENVLVEIYDQKYKFFVDVHICGEMRDVLDRFFNENGFIPVYEESPTKVSYLRARTTRILYSLLNAVGWRGIHRCHKEDFWCEWVYPYGFVPEAGCPRHD